MIPTASALERLLECPGSAALPQANTSNAYTEQGKEGHAEQEEAINDGTLPDALLEVLGDAAGSAKAEVKLALNVATGEGKVLGHGSDRYYPVQDGPFWVFGTADVMAFDADRVYITDKKLWLAVTPAERNIQVGFLALAAARALGKSEAVVALLYETGRVDKATLDMIDLDSLQARLRGLHVSIAEQTARRARGEMPDVREGSHCKHCPAEHVCPAKVALVRRLVSGEEASELDMLLPLDDATARKAYERLATIKSLTKRVESALYARASERPIPLGDGRFFGRHATRGTEELDGRITRDVVKAHLGDAAVDEVCEISVTKTRIKAAIGKRAAKGKAAATERALLDEIRKRGGSKREPGETVGEFTPTLQLAKEAS